MKPNYEDADIFRLYGEEYKKTHAISRQESFPLMDDDGYQVTRSICSGYNPWLKNSKNSISP